MNTLLSNWYVFAIALLAMVMFIVRGRMIVKQKYVAVTFLWAGAILLVAAVVNLPIKKTSLTPETLSNDLMDSATNSKPNVTVIYNADLLLDASGSVSNQEISQKISYLNTKYKLINCRYYAFGSFLAQCKDTSIHGIDSIRSLVNKDGIKLKGYTDIKNALTDYISGLDGKEKRNCVFISDDVNEDCPGSKHKTIDELRNLLAENDQLFFYLIRLNTPSKRPRFISENLGQFFSIDSVEKSGELNMYARKLAYSSLFSDARPWVTVEQGNEKLKIEKAVFNTQSGIVQVTLKSNFRFWPVLLNVNEVVVDHLNYPASAFFFLSPGASDSFSIFIGKARQDLSLIHHNHKSIVQLKYDLYFSGSNAYPGLQNAVGIKRSRDFRLKDLFYQSYESHSNTLSVNHKPNPLMIALVALLCFVTGVLINRLRKPGFHGYVYSVKNTIRNQWIINDIPFDETGLVKNEFNDIIGLFKPARSGVRPFAFSQPLDALLYDQTLLTKGKNNTYLAGEEYQIQIKKATV